MLRTLLALILAIGGLAPVSQGETDAGNQWDPDG
jgi:hypothetical protein